MSVRHPFDAATLPLRGVRVIEASAGTGKTHSLIALFLRAIGELGLRAEQVLMVTFTEAATADLRRRLDVALRRIVARPLSSQAADHEPYAALLSNIVATVGDAALVRARLALAAQSLDQAAIQTIHAFCRRVLRECAFEAGVDFDDPTPGAQAALWQEATRDFWQAYTLTLSLGEVEMLRERLGRGGNEPIATLARTVAELAALPRDALRPRDLAARRARLDGDLAQAASALRALIDDAVLAETYALLATDKGLRRDKSIGLPPARLDAAFDALRAWHGGDASAPVPPALACLATDALRAMMKPSAKTSPPAHALFERVAAACAASRTHEDVRYAEFLHEAIAAISTQVRVRQQARGTVGFNDLIERLATALAGPRGDLLAETLRRRHPLALVDEFQDTDPQQYAIFRRIYAAHDDVGLVLIGDPKQAIYRFRGGDVYAYAQALRDAGDAVHTLATNRRSEARVVHAINALFGAAAQPFRLSFVPFEPVTAADTPRDGHLRDPQRATGAVVWIDPGTRNNDVLEFDGTAACAEEIVRLLAGARDGTVRIGDRALRAGDIAVLVARNDQTERVRGALRARGVPVAAVSRESILQVDAAQDITAWLAAIAAPNDSRALRAALAQPAIGMDSATLGDGDAYVAAVAPWAERFAAAPERLREHGVLAALWPVVQAVAPGLLARPDGARHLGHLRHLVEWLAAQQPGATEPQALLAWFERRRAQPDPGDQSEALRPQDEGERVRVLTAHGSKGLEFGCVFVPFAWNGAREKPVQPLRWHDDEGGLVVDLVAGTEGDDARCALREEFDEQVRVAYVALTRAVHRVYVVFASNKTAMRSGIGQVLTQALDASLPAGEALAAAWAARVGASWEVLPLPESGALSRIETSPPPVLRALQPRQPAFAQWSSHSFSSLHHQADAAALPAADHDQWAAVRTDAPAGMSRQQAADFGDCFHQLMEELLAPTPASTPLTFAQQVARQAQRYDLPAERAVELAQFAKATLAASLAPGVPLSALRPDDYIVEMPFVFALGASGLARVATVLQRHGDFAHLAAMLVRGVLRLPGQMRGYIDLVVRADGRYYVLDYKTNRLAGPADYRGEGLARAMHEHGYDLQLLIYAVALHRQLRARLGANYDPARDFGGAIYLFVRGLAAGDGIYTRTLDAALLHELDLAFGTAEVAA